MCGPDNHDYASLRQNLIQDSRAEACGVPVVHHRLRERLNQLELCMTARDSQRHLFSGSPNIFLISIAAIRKICSAEEEIPVM